MTSVLDRVAAFQRAAAETGARVELHAPDAASAARLAKAIGAAALFIFSPAQAHEAHPSHQARGVAIAEHVAPAIRYCYRQADLATRDHQTFHEQDARGESDTCISGAPLETFFARRAGFLDGGGHAVTAQQAIARPQNLDTSGAIAKVKATLRRKDLERSPEALVVLPHLATQTCGFSLEDPQVVSVTHCVNVADKFPIEVFRAAAFTGNVVALGEYRGVTVLLGESESLDPLEQFNAFSFRFHRHKNAPGQEVMLLLKPLVTRLLSLPPAVREAALLFVMEHERGHLNAGDEYPEGPRTAEVVSVLIDLETNADFRAFAVMSAQGFDVATQRAAVQAVLGMAPESVELEITAARMARLEAWLQQESADLEAISRDAEQAGQMLAAR